MNIHLAGVYSRPNIFIDPKDSGLTYDQIGQLAEEEMHIYLAGGCTGNNNPIWRENRNSPEKMEEFFPIADRKIHILESFVYLKPWMDIYIKRYWNFMLDSGAFTFMRSAKHGHIDWEDYVEKYAAFINRLDLDLFFELDIDALIGVDETSILRRKLESLTGKKPIWVLQSGRTLEEFKEAVHEYPYVALSLSGMTKLSKDRRKMKPQINMLCNIAHRAGAKIHGLGFTRTDMRGYMFDSVDSTAWIFGNRAGYLFRFNGRELEKIKAKPGMKMKAKETALHNFNEWIKFQRWAEKNLGWQG